MYGFIYIVSEKTYYDELRKKSTYKYIPDFLFKKIDKKISGHILTEFKLKDVTIGYCIGITTREDLTKDELINRIKDSIEKKLPIEKLNSIIFENNDNISLMNKLIEEKILQTTDISKHVKIKTISFILKELMNRTDNLNKGMELLIIPKQEEDINIIIEKNLADIKYISVYTEDKEIGNSIFSKVMKETGLSIEVITNVSKVDRFDVIINFKNSMNFIKCIKRNSIVFNIYNNLLYEKNTGIIVDDFIFKNSGIININDTRINLKNGIPSTLYSYKEVFDRRDFRLLRVGEKFYNIEEFYDEFISKK